MSPLDPQFQTRLDAFFRAYEGEDREALVACFAEDAVYFGSMMGVELKGREACRSLFEAASGAYPGLRLRPGRIFGTGPELAMLVDLRVGDDLLEGVFAFRFDAGGEIERLSVIFDPQPFQLKRARGGGPAGVPLAEAFPPLPLDAPVQQALESYVATFNAGDEEAHMALFDPEVRFFGSMSRIDSGGLSTVRGVFHAARSSMGVRRLTALRTYGRRKELALRLAFAAEDAAGPPAEGIWIFGLSDEGRIQRLSTLWTPTFLPRRAP
ncbi:MAG: nuclear transport factor 2 family protein [Holophagaceae bacterium]|nr:nuclear transport factor 2 family protein [Holophagaceae bacterium]